MTVNRIRLDDSTVLDQKETRVRVWNPDTEAWEPATTDDLLTQILAKLEEIRVLLAA